MKKLIAILFIGVALFACDKTIDNPFDDPSLGEPVIINEEDTLDPSTLAYLQYKIFGPTCANSGCHDGTFEPNFTTIQSTYNTLVYHPIIKNDQSNSYTYRVQPGSANQSLLVERISGQMDGNEDQMPIVTEPGSDYPANQFTYISYIKNWINAGAKDMFNNVPVLGNKPAQVVGVFGYDLTNGGTTPLARENGSGAILVPSNCSSLELWFALTDDSTQAANISADALFSPDIDNFGSATPQTLNTVGSPIIELGYFGNNENYFHKLTVNPQQLVSGPSVYGYFRLDATDNSNLTVQIPNNSSFTYFKQYLSFIIEP